MRRDRPSRGEPDHGAARRPGVWNGGRACQGRRHERVPTAARSTSAISAAKKSSTRTRPNTSNKHEPRPCRPAGRGPRRGPCLRNDDRAGRGCGPSRARWHDVLLLPRVVPRAVSRSSRTVSPPARRGRWTRPPGGHRYTCPMDPEVRQIGPGPCPKCGMALEPVTVSVSTRTEWTCPMHPEIVRDEPGACPICGMALEPRRVALDDRNPELDDMWRRFRAAVVLTAPFLVVMVSDMLPSRPLHQTLGARTLDGCRRCSRRLSSCGPGGRSSSARGDPS